MEGPNTKKESDATPTDEALLHEWDGQPRRLGWELIENWYRNLEVNLQRPDEVEALDIEKKVSSAIESCVTPDAEGNILVSPSLASDPHWQTEVIAGARERARELLEPKADELLVEAFHALGSTGQELHAKERIHRYLVASAPNMIDDNESSPYWNVRK